MKTRSYSLVTRLALLYAMLSFTVLAAVGYALYIALVAQLEKRDDAALVVRVEQIRALMRDVNIVDLAREKPEVFANMLGNREALLIIKYPGEKPLIEVNPASIAIPSIQPVATNAVLALSSVIHSSIDDTPFIIASALVKTGDARQQGKDLQITTGRLLTERTRMLMVYRNQVFAVALLAALLTAMLAYWLARRSLRPLSLFAAQTNSISMAKLSTRINDSDSNNGNNGGNSRASPQELQPLIEGFNAMLHRLETGFSQLSQVSADMAHDLRTPINNLLGQTEVALGQKRSNEYYEKLLGSNFEELQRLSHMTDNMLFLARAEHADHAIERKELDVASEFTRLAEYFEGLAEEREIKILWQGNGKIWADPDLLRRALANLLSNAVRYADTGTTITLAAKKEDGGMHISVENTGATIETHHLARLFERFYRADSSRRDSAGASGLGLSIVRSIMLLHQGRWSVTSEQGLTCFSLFFPDRCDLSGDK
ncbi:heavy metal sensor histidine kinase [Undibacterium sp. Tian12W]|uniref:heavy metal sensor histidine kinase n=1 Tax=Undibacterium sp. Tian12W TaxID=3413054 RepID=UPI003BF31B93